MTSGGSALSLGIVTVSYGHADVLPVLVSALSPQLRENDQLVVVDNGSDDVASRLRGIPHVDRVITTGTNTGFATGCNVGAAELQTDVVVLLNPDCVPEVGFIDAMRRPPEYWDAWMGVVAMESGQTVNNAGGVVHYSGIAWSGRCGDPIESVGATPACAGFLSGACMAVRRPVWQALGGLAEDYFMYMEDVEISHRLRLGGHRFGVIPAARVRHDYEFHKGSRKWELLERNRWLTVLRTYPTPLLLSVLPSLVALEPLLLAASLRDGWFVAKLKSWGGVARVLPRTLSERRAIQNQRRVSIAEFAEGLTAEVSSPFLGAVGRSAVACTLSGAYWSLVRRVIRGR